MSEVLLQAKAVRKAFGGHVVLDEVNLTLRRRDVVLLEGQNGSGKTTLLNILSGCLTPDRGTIEFHANGHPRRFDFPRAWWQALSLRGGLSPESAASCGIGRTWQDVRLFGSQTLRENIAVGVPKQPGENPALVFIAPRHVRNFERAVQERTAEALKRFLLPDRASSSADKVSLGQAKKVAIARAVQAGARVLFLDEPLAGLDANGIVQVTALLKDLVRRESLTLVIVEHVLNHAFLADLVNIKWQLAAGRLNEINSAKNGESDVDQTTFWRSALGDGAGMVEGLPRGAVLIRIPPAIPDGAAGLDIRGLVVGHGSRPVIGVDDSGRVEGFNLRVAAGETTVLLAPNGWGKTTLCNAIGAGLPSSRGAVEHAAEGLHYFPADATLFPNLSCAEFLDLSGMKNTPASAGLDGFARRQIGSLSGGERKRLQLSLLDKVPDGAVAVIDEPLSSLDREHMNSFLQRVRARRGRVTFFLLAPRHL